MIGLLPDVTERPLRVLCLGAHPDDVEIGMGATLLRLQQERPVIARTVIFSGSDLRRAEQATATSLLFANAVTSELEIFDFRESFFPDQWTSIKEALHPNTVFEPDLVFAPRLDDRHQDHRTLAEVTWQSFRNHLILQYEIPKFEGDLGRPDTYVPIDDATLDQKIEIISTAYATQTDKPWFDADTFRGLARVRGVECNHRWAEAFHSDKAVLLPLRTV
ncbi:MAG: PIG-L deacetylase family protein [Actinomycetota bacterium]